MKLILCSSGFNTVEMVEACEQLVGKPRSEINIAVINEAYAVVPDNNLRWVLEELTRMPRYFGGNLELVNLLALDKDTIAERLHANDVIYMEGGHSDYLYTVLKKSGYMDLLPDLLKSKVYVGSSAGSMVMGHRLSSEAYEIIYDEMGEYGVTDYMGYVDFAIMPHLNSPDFPNRKETLEKAVAHYDGVVYGIQDDTAIIVDDRGVRTIGTPPLTFGK